MEHVNGKPVPVLIIWVQDPTIMGCSMCCFNSEEGDHCPTVGGLSCEAEDGRHGHFEVVKT